MTAVDTRAPEPAPETEPSTAVTTVDATPDAGTTPTGTTVVVKAPTAAPVGFAPWSPPPRQPLPLLAFGTARIASVVCLLAIWAVLFLTFLSGLQEMRSQHLLYNELREQLAGQTEPIGGNMPPGTPVALLDAPSIGLHQIVVEGTAPGDLRAGPGHRRDTPLPGQSGNSVIYGRALSYGGPFQHITDLHAGDTITVSTGQGVFTYKVDEVRRSGDPLPDPVRTGTGRLTLTTAEGTSWRAGWAPNEAVYVDATLQGPTQPAPGGQPTAVPAAELAMGVDWGALTPLVLWLQVLVAAAIGATWAQARWGGAQAWLVGMPVLLLAVWEVSDSAMQLLPNLM